MVCGAQCWVNCLNLVFDIALDLMPFFLGGLGITLPPFWVCHISSQLVLGLRTDHHSGTTFGCST